ncbi:unnamed protein product [Microthlaspi erraticum]|uniref:ATP-dependent DNA helicase n=1 Tax=Microthlaspi erraticum TaxID=1685480 RepID=A0A6D2KHL0_9BRAS|nr:unnamed protein product [Microthlaspi erraticum]
MPKPRRTVAREENVLIVDEKSYNQKEQKENHDRDLPKLTDEQKKVYDEIVGAVLERTGGVFFLFGFGGTGKTFLWKILSSAIRCRGEIVLNVASSGIASLLLQGGRTAHSRFGIPINPHETSTCNMEKGGDLANLVKEASLIIWDEAPMMHKHCFVSLDRSLSHIVGNEDGKPFGEKVVFGDDFRQVLPVIHGAGRAEVVCSALNSSYLWKHCKIEEPNDGEAEINIPEEFLITDAEEPIEAISREIYGDASDLQDNTDPLFFQGRAILCPTNEDVNMINEYMLDKLNGEERIYLSSDTIDPCDTAAINDEALSTEFLNSIRVAGLPNHALRLKVGCPVMLLRNIDPIGGLMNGTRLQITQLADFMVEAKVITGDKVGVKVIIPRLLITPSDTLLPFKMRRRQLPLAVAFAITINKSQGQSLSQVGIFLPRPVFSHGQLYVAISRVTSKKGLKILIVDSEGKPQRRTTNVVFKEGCGAISSEDDWIIRVKVLKKWTEMIDGGGEILRFQLVDEHDGKIPAKVSDEDGLYDHFDMNVHEGHWKLISGFVVELTPPEELFSENQHTIVFTDNTPACSKWYSSRALYEFQGLHRHKELGVQLSSSSW